MRYLSMDELATRADHIVEAVVVEQEVVLVEGMPTTVSTLQVTSCYGASACPKSLVVSQLGGEVGDIGLAVSGVEPLEVGTPSLLFLRKGVLGLTPLGAAQGVFTKRLIDGEEHFERELAHLALVGTRGPVKTRNSALPARFMRRWLQSKYLKK